MRCLGAIGVVELENPVCLKTIQPHFVEQGIWIRPFGKLVYTMPPFIANQEEVGTINSGIKKVLADYLQ